MRYGEPKRCSTGPADRKGSQRVRSFTREAKLGRLAAFEPAGHPPVPVCEKERASIVTTDRAAALFGCIPASVREPVMTAVPTAVVDAVPTALMVSKIARPT